MRILKILLVVVLVLLLIAVVGLLVWVWRWSAAVESSPQAEIFRRGVANLTPLDSEFRGKVNGYSSSWQGKSFDLASRSGVNRWRKDSVVESRYPFGFEVAKSLRDQDLDVVRLDYDRPESAWWLRFVVDEIVEVAPNSYLGKVYLRPVSGVAFSLGYFTLDRN